MATRHANEEVKVQIRWYEKLHNWDKALNLYQEKLESKSNDIDSRLGQMRCLEALGEWEELGHVTKAQWNSFDLDGKSRAGRLAAVAAWGLQDWEGMQEYVRCIPENTQDGSFYRAVLAVHYGNFETAQKLIDETRDLLDTELTSMAGESYERAYGAMVCVQMLTELEEVIQYKLIPERREKIRGMWWERLQGGQRIVEDWQRIIQVHTLVVNPQEDVQTWLKYAALCRKSGSFKLSHKTLSMLLEVDPLENPNIPIPHNKPRVTYAYAKHLHLAGQIPKAYECLNEFVLDYSKNCKPEEVKEEEKRRLLARCYRKLGQWQTEVQGLNEISIKEILDSYDKATKYDTSWYKAWHSWAFMNFKIVQEQKQQIESLVGDHLKLQKQIALVCQYVVPAVDGFFRSINLSQGNSLQDTLRLLTLWFEYGQFEEVDNALVQGMRLIQINTWLQVIPQLIARIDTPRQRVGDRIHQLLNDIGKHHPQALVYPLTVASKSVARARKAAAHKILKSICEHSSKLVDQAMMLSDELIRVAILWHEQWHEGLEEASRCVL